MKYLTTTELAKKWHISERRVRVLLKENRIENATKVGHSWLIPDNAIKPGDQRTMVNHTNDLIIPEDNLSFYEIDKLKKLYDKNKNKNNNSLQDAIRIEWTYNSNGIEGNTLTLKETKTVLEGITVGGKSLKEHLKVINHDKAILYVNQLIQNKEPLTEEKIKSIQQLLLKGIDDENAGVYRKQNVMIQGSKYVPPEAIFVPELMERLMTQYANWKSYHPIVQSSLLYGEFIKIYPFVNGNGVVARLLMNYILMSYGYPPVIIEKRNKNHYYHCLEKVLMNNDYCDFILLITTLEEKMLGIYLKLI